MTNQTAQEIATVAPNDAKERIDAGSAALIDVRIAYEYAKRHVPGSLSIAGPSLKHRKPEVPADKELIFLSEDDAKSKRSAEAAVALELTNVAVLEGGIEAWEQAQLPVEKSDVPAPEIKTVDAAEAKAKTDTEVAQIIDVRMPFDWAGGRIRGSINLPNVSIKVRRGEIPEDKELIFVAWDDTRSRTAAEVALSQGFTTIAVLEGGMQAWIDAGLPTETSSGS